MHHETIAPTEEEKKKRMKKIRFLTIDWNKAVKKEKKIENCFSLDHGNFFKRNFDDEGGWTKRKIQSTERKILKFIKKSKLFNVKLIINSPLFSFVGFFFSSSFHFRYLRSARERHS